MKPVSFQHVDIQTYAPAHVPPQNARLPFTRRVYGLVCVQLVLAGAVCAAAMYQKDFTDSVSEHTALFYSITLVVAFVSVFPLYSFRRAFPANYFILATWTAAVSLAVGTACALAESLVVLEALALTAAVTTGLTLYTFTVVDLETGVLGPWLFSSLSGLIVFGIGTAIFPVGEIWKFFLALVGACIFSLYVVYGTSHMAERYDPRDYVWCSVGIYLDVVNLFGRITGSMKSCC